LLLCSFHLNASMVVNGTFEAVQSCPAYVSKNNKTNPDNLVTEPSQIYSLREINKSQPDWFRIVFPNVVNSSSRWVSATCGRAEYTLRDISSCTMEVGLADSNVLALSSQPGFCQTYGYEAGKPECLKLSAQSYQANHLTLHGLWPNQDACGQHYGFCGSKPQANHCDYSPVNLSTAVAQDLKRLMPSYNYGSCLERHEWNKHGSCQILTSDNYFALAMRLATEVNQSEFGRYLTLQKGKRVRLAKLRDILATSFGIANGNKVHLGCKQSILVDVLIQLPALIPLDESLKSLISKAPDSTRHDSCSSNVTISDFNKMAWF
jgi:ribonuclease T2